MFKENLVCANIDEKLSRQLLEENKDDVIGYIRNAYYDYNDTNIMRQQDIIINFCRKFNVECKEIYIDNGFSGLDYERPGIKEIIRLKKHKVILMSDISRLSRSYSEIINFIDKANISIIGITDGIIIKDRKVRLA